MKTNLTSTLLALTTSILALGAPALAQDAPAPREYAPVTNEIILNPPAEEWIMWRRTLDNQGYSPLDQVELLPAPSGFPLNGGGFLQEVQLAMSTTCDMLSGITVQADPPYAGFASITRPYATIPFVLAVTDPSYASLASIPHDKRLGTAIGSRGEQALLIYQTQLPEAQRWRRLPYADPELMLRRLKDGTLAGIILWQPTLHKLLGDDPAASGVHTIPLDPVPDASVMVGALVSNRDTFLRSQVDQAIDSLVADGTIARLMEEFGFEGTPGG